MDVIAGEPSMMMDALATMKGQITANQVRAIGVASLKRTETAPDLPAIAETVPGYSGDAWLGFMAPAGTPPEIVNKLQQEIAKVLARPEVIGRLPDAGCRAGRQHAGAVRRVPQGRDREMGQGDPHGRHQDRGVIQFSIGGEPAGLTKQESPDRAGPGFRLNAVTRRTKTGILSRRSWRTPC